MRARSRIRETGETESIVTISDETFLSIHHLEIPFLVSLLSYCEIVIVSGGHRVSRATRPVLFPTAFQSLIVEVMDM